MVRSVIKRFRQIISFEKIPASYIRDMFGINRNKSCLKELKTGSSLIFEKIRITFEAARKPAIFAQTGRFLHSNANDQNRN